VVLPTTAGMHRVAWDLRYSDPPTLNYGYSGNLLDYREYTLSWHAIPGKTPRSTLVGPLVLPGTYTATLTVNGRSYTQPVPVVPDPRVSATATALAAQFRLQQRIVAGIAVTYRGFNYIQELHEALAKAGDVPAARSLDTAVTALASGPAGLGTAHRDLGRRLNDQLVGDAEPTPSVIAGVDGPCKAIDAALDTLRGLQATAFAEVNAALARGGGSALPAWTPPAAPACGAK
jgi:hypothetical protein